MVRHRPQEGFGAGASMLDAASKEDPGAAVPGVLHADVGNVRGERYSRAITGERRGPSAKLLNVLRRFELMDPDEAPELIPLRGGVSSDIWRVNLRQGPVCIKRARSKLKVAADWRVPVERNAYEVSWMRIVNEVAPGTAPKILAHEPKMGLFIMDYLDPDTFRLWKEELRKGRAEPSTAGAVGDRLARIAALTANDPAIALRFASDDIFKAIRLEPYLEAAARAHPDRAAALLELIESTAKTKRALVHGDVSPKNILIGSDGPVFLDAECAWYGDPAFDLAFCLNHLLLKCVWVPPAKSRFLACFARLTDAYRANVTWEPVQNIEKRAARLVPGLLLARVDGKSPVEYLVSEHDKNSVRRVARTLLAKPVDTLDEVRAAWSEEVRS